MVALPDNPSLCNGMTILCDAAYQPLAATGLLLIASRRASREIYDESLMCAVRQRDLSRLAQCCRKANQRVRPARTRCRSSRPMADPPS